LRDDLLRGRGPTITAAEYSNTLGLRRRVITSWLGHQTLMFRFPSTRAIFGPSSLRSTRNNGFRIDHAFLSQELAACAGSGHYSHEERITGISDHSPLILELAN